VCAEEGQEFLLFGSVLRYLRTGPGNDPAARLSLLKYAQRQAANMQPLFAIPALIACLRVCAPPASSIASVRIEWCPVERHENCSGYHEADCPRRKAKGSHVDSPYRISSVRKHVTQELPDVDTASGGAVAGSDGNSGLVTAHPPSGYVGLLVEHDFFLCAPSSILPDCLCSVRGYVLKPRC
jgi:hypothetical protein